MDIFISYARKDRARVNKIANALEKEGYTVWWDRHIRAGQKFQQEINKAIKSTKAVVVVWSKHSITSHWVQDEAQHGVTNNALVPVMIDEVATPLGFGQIHSSMLYDGGDNPTASEEWEDFLESVREVVGEGEGTPSPDDPLAQLLTRPVSTESASTAAPTPAPAPAPKRLLPASGWNRYAPIGALVLALLVAAIFLPRVLGPSNETGPLALIPEDKPVVIGIIPSNSFGLGQQNGVKETLGGNPRYTYYPLTAPVADMKARQAEDLLAELDLILDNREVVAIVGPSITEFTPIVLERVEESGVEPAIVLLTAGSREVVGWENSSLPIFRVGSGMDERSAQFAETARGAIGRGVNLVFLVENAPEPVPGPNGEPAPPIELDENGEPKKTYGQFFYDQITKELDDLAQWQAAGRATTIDYTAGRITETFAGEESQQIFNQRNLIVVLGLSADLSDLVGRFYNTEQAPRTAMVAGWNISGRMLELDEDEAYGLQYERLLDMTDVYRRSSEGDAPDYIASFVDTFDNPVLPSLRNEAVAFDSGLVIKQAADNMEGEITAAKLVSSLRRDRFVGVTGRIYFDPEGRNTGHAGGLSPLYSLTYDPAARSWRRINSLDELFARQVASR